MTLDDLRTEFERAALAVSHFTWDFNASSLAPQQKAYEALRERAQLASTIYDIAKAKGLNAAMLYKLSDGAIDPRAEQ